MKFRFVEVGIFLVFICLALFPFRNYFLYNKVPLPFNLLVSYYSPWKFEKDLGYGIRIPNKPLGYDNLKLFYPFRKFTVEEMKSGHVPLWNPFVFSGNIHLATYQSAVFYPFTILYFILPMPDAWTWLIILQPILSGWFTFLFLRTLKLSRNASFFGALGFAFSGWMIAMWEEVLVLEHSILWLPLALYASNSLWEREHVRRNIFVLIFALSMSVLAGFLQMSLYLFFVVFLWNIYKWFSLKYTPYRNRIAWYIAASFLLAISLSSIQWFPALEAYMLSPRGVVDSANLFQMFLSPATHLITFIVPDFWGNPGSYNYFSKLRYIQERTIYVGIFILIFAILAFFQKAKRDQRFWKLFTLVTFSFGFALPTSWVWYILRIPILSVAQPARIFALSTFGFCILAAYGIDEWRRHQTWGSVKRFFIAICILLIFLWLFVFGVRFVFSIYQPSVALYCSKISQNSFYQFILSLLNFCDKKLLGYYASVSFRNLAFSTALVGIAWIIFFLTRKKWTLFYVSAICITIFGSFYFANKILYFSDRKFEFPSVEPLVKLKQLSGYYRVWSYGDAYVMRNMFSYYNIYSPEGYDALFSQRYGELLHVTESGGMLRNQITRVDASLRETSQNDRIGDNPSRLRIMSLLGVKYVLSVKSEDEDNSLKAEDRFPNDLFSLVWNNDTWRIWEFKQALPRAYFASRYVVERDRQKIVNLLLDPSFDLQQTVILEDKPKEFESANSPKNNASSRVDFTDYRSQKVDVRVEAQQNGFLFLSDNFYPGWKAFVDGKPANIYRADYSFRAVPVPAGTHIVRFVYDPVFYKVAVVVSLVTIVAIFLFLIFLKHPIESRQE